MKQNLRYLAVLISSLLTLQSFSQTSYELIFKNPVLVSGTDKRTGATYRFYNVRSGTDALLTIASASETAQLINNIDVTEHGWDKAFQPEIGKSGSAAANQTWWVRFNLKFVYANTSTKRKLDKFYATAIDVDGDNSVMQEFIQMYSPDSVKYRTVTELAPKTPLSCGITGNSNTYCTLGPVKNYTNIDTAATQVMATYTFLNTDEINFVYGAKVGNGSSTAGLRLNSLWFKSFDLNIVNKTLPIKNTSFILTSDKRNVTLQWAIAGGSFVKDFVVEKSSDGTTFQTVQTLQPTDGKLAYTYTDASVSSSTGVLYYRILFRELSGEASYSVVKQARLSKETNSSLGVYPNPVRSSANLTLPADWQNKSITLAVFNTAGIQVQNVYVPQASQTESLSFSTVAKGIYVVKAQCNGQWLEQRVIKD